MARHNVMDHQWEIVIVNSRIDGEGICNPGTLGTGGLDAPYGGVHVYPASGVLACNVWYTYIKTRRHPAMEERK
jgi:hypothetical protein